MANGSSRERGRRGGVKRPAAVSVYQAGDSGTK